MNAITINQEANQIICLFIAFQLPEEIQEMQEEKKKSMQLESNKNNLDSYY